MGVDLIEARERAPLRVLIAGGGVAALEAALALRALAPRALSVEMLAPDREFHGGPLSVAEPFGLASRRHLELQAFASDNSVRLHRGTLESVDVPHRFAHTGAGERLGYDALLVAVGAAPRVVLPGALTFRGPVDVPAFRALLDEVEEGWVRSIAFTVPRPVRWSLPLYELALMTAAWAASKSITLRVELVTHERAPLEIFGPRVSKRISSLLRSAGIHLRTRLVPLVAQPGRVFLAPDGVVAADRTVALAKLVVPDIPGLPQGPGGFIPTDAYGRVDGAPNVYAAGDATWFPVKQGGLAAQQADAAASAIAHDADARVEPEPFAPILRGVLLTGDAPQYLRSTESPAGGESAEHPLWLPVAKIAGRHLGAYIAGGDPDDPIAVTDVQPADDAGGDHVAALELALEAAEAAAGWDDPADALRWLSVAEGLNVALPMAYAGKRRRWTEALSAAGHRPATSR